MPLEQLHPRPQSLFRDFASVTSPAQFANRQPRRVFAASKYRPRGSRHRAEGSRGWRTAGPVKSRAAQRLGLPWINCDLSLDIMPGGRPIAVAPESSSDRRARCSGFPKKTPTGISYRKMLEDIVVSYQLWSVLPLIGKVSCWRGSGAANRPPPKRNCHRVSTTRKAAERRTTFFFVGVVREGDYAELDKQGLGAYFFA
jgi:hypothetical protein